eukprot:11103-Amphidinium_carterae.1
MMCTISQIQSDSHTHRLRDQSLASATEYKPILLSTPPECCRTTVGCHVTSRTQVMIRGSNSGMNVYCSLLA